MTYNIIKLIVVALLICFIIVAIGLDWIGEALGWGSVGILIGYIVGNAQVAPSNEFTAPIIKRD